MHVTLPNDRTRSATRLASAVAVGVMLLAVAPVSLRAQETGCLIKGLDDRCEKWTTSYGRSDLRAMVLSPLNDRIFIGGGRLGLAAVNAATGAKQWEAKLPGTGKGTSPDAPVRSLAVSPDGQRVYAIGDDVASNAIKPPTGPYNDFDLIVAAYDAATGALVWRKELGLAGIQENDRIESIELARAITASPDGRRVYVAGVTVLFDRLISRRVILEDMIVAGFDASSGAKRWSATWGDRLSLEFPAFLAVSPDSKHLYVGGDTRPCDFFPRNQGCHGDVAAVALRAFEPSSPSLEGKALWAREWDGGMGVDDELSAMDLSSDGSRLVITGGSQGEQGENDYDYGTISLRTSNGSPAWADRYQPTAPHPALSTDAETHRATAVAFSPSSDSVYVTGTTGTVAYASANGQERWLLYGFPEVPPDDGARSVDVAPNGSRVYILSGRNGSAPSGGPLTSAINSGTTAPVWVARGSGTYQAGAPAWVVASSDGTSVFTAGTDWTVQAYEVAL